MTTLTARAQAVAGELREPGFGAAGISASAWRARVCPEATRGLVAAAMILTDGDAGAALWVPGEPCPDDRTLLGWSAELEGQLAELLRHCRDQKTACEAQLDSALRAHAAATSAAQAAKGRTTAASAPDAHAAAEAEYQAAMERARAAAVAAADCEGALEILGDALTRLDAAVNALRQVPADLHDAYETPYRHLRENGPLPRDGDFLTGTAEPVLLTGHTGH